MSITSYGFSAFAAAAVVAFNLVPPRQRAPFLLAVSYAFCASLGVLPVTLLCVITGIAYGAALLCSRNRSSWLLAATVTALATPLVAFKGVGLFTPMVNSAGTIGNTAVPLGLSFVTFTAIAYVIDVRLGRLRPGSLDHVALHLAFFPKLLAGPIERATDLLPQVRAAAPSTFRNVYTGLKIVLWGLFCKLVVADNIAPIVDGVLRTPSQESGLTLSCAFGLYAFQIYFDFLGYTNIAIGLARCFNIHLTQNFRQPYGATSLQEFWRRWHISLSSWFRDYLYLPLGGRATRGWARVWQILLVFVVSGLWHGATPNFIAWGGFHGVAYLTEQQLRKMAPRTAWASRRSLRILLTRIQQAATFMVVTFGWVFFRLTDTAALQMTITKIFGVNTDVPYRAMNATLMRSSSAWFVVLLVSAVLLDSSRLFRESLDRVPDAPFDLVRELVYVNWLGVSLLLVGDLGVRDFTYLAF